MQVHLGDTLIHIQERNTICVIYVIIGAMTCDFQQCGILTSVDSDETVHSHY